MRNRKERDQEERKQHFFLAFEPEPTFWPLLWISPVTELGPAWMSHFPSQAPIFLSGTRPLAACFPTLAHGHIKNVHLDQVPGRDLETGMWCVNPQPGSHSQPFILGTGLQPHSCGFPHH